MSTTMKKTLLISLVIFLTIIAAVSIVYLVKKPTKVTLLPSPSIVATAKPLQIAEVGGAGSVGFNTSATCVAKSGNTYQCSPTQIGTSCENGTGRFDGRCVFWKCPYGDTNNDCGCGLGDTGATSEIMSCETAKTKATTTGNTCYQFDALDSAANWCVIDGTCRSVQDNFRTCIIQTPPITIACTKTFVVACASPSPSPSPSTTPSIIPSPSPSTPPSANLDCVAKKMYSDDSRNRAGFYYLEKEITDTNVLQNGQIIVYNVVTKNAGGNGAPDTTITDKLSSNLTYVDGDSGCTYNSTTRTVTCTIGTLSPNSEAQRSFRATVAVVGTASVANTAEVSSTNGQRDSCSVKIDATGKVVTVSTPAPTSLPVAGVFEVTAGTIGIGFLLLIAGALGLLLI